MSSDACMPWASFLADSTNHSPGVWIHFPVESASFHSDTVQRLPMSLSKVSAGGVGVSRRVRGAGASAASRVAPGCGVRGSGHVCCRRMQQRGLSHWCTWRASVASVCTPVLQPSLALQRVRGARWEGRNSPSKNTLALAEASASAAKSRVIMFAVVRCNTGVAPFATAVCDAQTSTRRDWGSLEVGCPRPGTRREGCVL